jgi:hypothetical protein
MVYRATECLSRCQWDESEIRLLEMSFLRKRESSISILDSHFRGNDTLKRINELMTQKDSGSRPSHFICISYTVKNFGPLK